MVLTIPRMFSIIAASVLTISAIGASPSLPDPVFWCYSAAEGAAASNEHFVNLIRFHCHYEPGSFDHEGEWAIDEAGAHAGGSVAWLAEADYYTTRPVGIMIGDFAEGMGDPASPDVHDLTSIFLHWCDGLPDTGIADDPFWSESLLDAAGCWATSQLSDTEADLWWNTPWTSHGTAESGVFMDAFVQAYLQSQANEGSQSPDPSRLFFDMEGRIQVVTSSNDALEAFHSSRFDPRWGSAQSQGESIFGFPGKDMYQLFEVESGITYDETLTLAWSNPANTAWIIWYANLTSRIMDASIMDAVMEPISAARSAGFWPEVRSNNYQTSIRVEDAVGFDWIAGSSVGVTSWWQGFHPWSETDLQAPAFYSVNMAHTGTVPGESDWDATLRVHRHNLDLMVDSLPIGGDPEEIVPWIENVDVKLPIHIGTGCPEDCSVYYNTTKYDIRRLLALCRSRGLREFVVWQNNSDDGDWDAMADLHRQVWMYDVAGVQVAQGIPMGDTVVTGNISSRDLNSAYMLSEPASGMNKVASVFAFQTDETLTSEYLMFTVEADSVAGLGTDVVVEGSVWNFGTAAWQPLDFVHTFEDTLSGVERRAFTWKTVPSLMGGYVSPGGFVMFRCDFANSETDAPFLVRIDSVQAVEADGPIADAPNPEFSETLPPPGTEGGEQGES